MRGSHPAPATISDDERLGSILWRPRCVFSPERIIALLTAGYNARSGTAATDQSRRAALLAADVVRTDNGEFECAYYQPKVV